MGWQPASASPKFMCAKVHGASSGTWVKLLTNGAYGNYDVGAAKFNDVFRKSGDFVIKRVCSNCRSDYKEVYYRRYTSPASFAPYDYMKMNWFSRNNVLNKDFGIFSSYEDAMAKRNPWKYCNYDDPGVGFPRDCGVTGYVAHQWNAFSGSRHAGGSRSVAYYIHSSTSAGTTIQASGGPKIVLDGVCRKILPTVCCGGTQLGEISGRGKMMHTSATFRIVKGLWGSGTISLQNCQTGNYYRHAGFTIYGHSSGAVHGSTLGKRDSSWYLVNGQHGGLSFKSENYPDRTLRHQNYWLYLHPTRGMHPNYDDDFKFSPPLKFA